MKIQARERILSDIICKSKKYSTDWKAAYHKVPNSFSTEYYIFHENVGVYLIQEYQKSPYKIRGIGSQIARKVDEEVQDQITRHSGNFGIIQGDFNKIMKNLKQGLSPETIICGAFQGEDYGINIPVKGKISTSHQIISNLNHKYNVEQRKLSKKLDLMMQDDNIYMSYS